MIEEERLKSALQLRLGDVVTFLLGPTEYTKAKTPEMRVTRLVSDYDFRDVAIYVAIDSEQGDPFKMSYKDLYTINGKKI